MLTRIVGAVAHSVSLFNDLPTVQQSYCAVINEQIFDGSSGTFNGETIQKSYKAA